MVGFAGFFDTPMDNNPYLLRNGVYVNLYEAARVIQVAAPATGATVVTGAQTTHLLINNTALLAALTINLPAPYINRSLRIGARSAITLLNIVPTTGVTVVGNLGSLVVGGYAEFIYVASALAWFRMG